MGGGERCCFPTLRKKREGWGTQFVLGMEKARCGWRFLCTGGGENALLSQVSKARPGAPGEMDGHPAQEDRHFDD
jgi:hypothetical protein